MNDLTYAVSSLELHLFFARIMKEHSLFLQAAFTPLDARFARQANFYRTEFERLLERVVMLANGRVSESVINSGEIVTRFTRRAELQTERFTGIDINLELTEEQLRLRAGTLRQAGEEFIRQVRMVNRTAVRLLDGLIALKEHILAQVTSCRMFTLNYPLLLEHIMREAKLYRSYVHELEENGELSRETMSAVEQFWNRIMMEHALFIRGLLDPSENELITAANSFAQEYAGLLNESRAAQEAVMTQTERFRDFKAAGTQGIEDCKIRSIILPLLADHVLREANHYLRLLR